MAETKGTTVNKEVAAETKPGEQEYSIPVRILRWFIISFFKIVEGIIRLFGMIYYGIKTMAVLLFRFFVWPYPIFFRRHK
jgi:hypothetical protein